MQDEAAGWRLPPPGADWMDDEQWQACLAPRSGASRGRCDARAPRPGPARRQPAQPTWCSAGSPPSPDLLWVADFTYVPAWTGMAYVAFAVDACSRRILGWRAATSMKTALVLDALDQALWTRRREGRPSWPG